MSILEIFFVVGRVFFGLFFVVMGLNHFMKTKKMTMYAESKGTPFPMVTVIGSGLMLLVGGLGIIAWYYVPYALSI